MYPHERSLVKRYANKPFALIGINSDPKEKLKSVMKDQNITWRSFWDGGNTSGPIASQWNVTGWPTIYVIDAKGTIRYKNVYGKKLNQAIEKLIQEVDSK